MPTQLPATRFLWRERSEIGATISLSRLGSWSGGRRSWRVGALVLCAALALLPVAGRAQRTAPPTLTAQVLPGDPFYSVMVTPDGQAITVNPGALSYTFSVKNTGNIADIYDLVASCSGSASACTPAVSSTSVAKGATKTIVVNYTAASVGGPGTVTLQDPVRDGKDLDHLRPEQPAVCIGEVDDVVDDRAAAREQRVGEPGPIVVRDLARVDALEAGKVAERAVAERAL